MENAFLQRYFLGNIFFSEKISKICTWKANVIIVNISQQILTEKRSVFISYHSPVQGQLSSRKSVTLTLTLTLNVTLTGSNFSWWQLYGHFVHHVPFLRQCWKQGYHVYAEIKPIYLNQLITVLKETRSPRTTSVCFSCSGG